MIKSDWIFDCRLGVLKKWGKTRMFFLRNVHFMTIYVHKMRLVFQKESIAVIRDVVVTFYNKTTYVIMSFSGTTFVMHLV